MTFTLQYELDASRLISGVINDSRGSILALKNATGMQIYAYIQSQIALVTTGIVVYRVIALGGVLAGYVGINTNAGFVGPTMQQFRPAFIPYSSQISEVINNFVINRTYLQDVLY